MKRLPIIFVGLIFLLAACSPLATSTPTPMPTASATALPTVTLTLWPTVTVTLTNTVTPQPTKDTFDDLSICRNWQESVKCPITENDFKRISKFVKANFKFPAESLKLGFLADVSDTGGNTFMFWPSTEGLDPTLAAKIDKGGINGLRSYVYGKPLSPIGEPFFFNLPANGSRVTEPIVVAVYPINNADGSLGTYTIIAPPFITINKEFSTRETAALRRHAFQRLFYCPPVYTMGKGRQEFFDRGEQGTWADEVFKDMINPNGTRMRLLDDFRNTKIISAEMEETPFFFANIPAQVDFFNK
jgi:hypothetical protein